MATKYFCDVCRDEKDVRELSLVEVTKEGEFPRHFDICKDCFDKMFKAVKVWNSHMKISVEVSHDK